MRAQSKTKQKNKDKEIKQKTPIMKRTVYKIIALTLLCVLLIGSLASCRKRANYVKLTIKDIGEVVIQLDYENAPKTCENFVRLVDEGFYNGLTFHRVISGFMVQGGCPKGTGGGNSGTFIEGEFFANGHANAISHIRSTVSMARSDPYDSASCQFFICVGDAPHLDGQYAGFGYVIEGMEVVDEIVRRTAHLATDGNGGGIPKDKHIVIERAESLSDYKN